MADDNPEVGEPTGGASIPPVPEEPSGTHSKETGEIKRESLKLGKIHEYQIDGIFENISIDETREVDIDDELREDLRNLPSLEFMSGDKGRETPSLRIYLSPGAIHIFPNKPVTQAHVFSKGIDNVNVLANCYEDGRLHTFNIAFPIGSSVKVRNSKLGDIFLYNEPSWEKSFKGKIK